jgi:mannose-1-phosphate guanylyltransferase
VRACLPELAAENLLFEPAARNTAACCAYAALEIARREPDAVQLVMPADHVISPPEKLRATLAAGAELAATSGALVTFGIRPTHPATGFGYIEQGERAPDAQGHAVHEVARFVEKPDLERAESFLATGRFLWNAGIFAWTGKAILDAFERHAPDISQPLREVLGDPARLAEVYPKLPSRPVDVAILEQAERVLTLPIDYDWNDVGSWSALAEIAEPDTAGNWPSLTDGAELIAEDSAGNIAYAEGNELIALVGVQDLVVVRSGHITLVCPRDRAQDVKRIVERLAKSERGQRHL